MNCSFRFGAAGAMLLLCSATLRPQTTGDASFRVDVDLREVDLVVTDAKGHHVTDLTAEDFQVFQDGRPQKTSNFSWIEVTPPPSGSQLAALQKPVSFWEHITGVGHIMKTPGNDIAASPVANPKKEEIRRTIAFVMNGTTMPVMDRIRKLVDEQLLPSDMVSIRSTSRSVVPLPNGKEQTRDSMGMFQQFTNDKRQLDAALDRVPRTCDYIHRCVPDVVGTLMAAIRSLRDVPGRKALVFVGGYTGPVDPIVNMAHQAGVVIYAINPAGISIDPADLPPGSESLVQLAKNTGGTWLGATPGPDMTSDLNLVMEDLSGYYLIGFHPDQSDPENLEGGPPHHRIEVKVLRPGLLVRARNTEVGAPGVLAEPAKPQGREDVLSRTLFSMFTEDGVHVHLEPAFLASAPDEKTHRRRPIVRARLDIEGRDLVGVDESGGRRFAFDLALAVFNMDGSQAGGKNMAFSVIVPPEKIEKVASAGMQYTLDVPVSGAGPYQIRAAIRDQKSTRIGSSYAYLSIPDFNKRRVSLASLSLSPGYLAVGTAGRPTWNEFVRGGEVRFNCEIFGLKNGAPVEAEVRLYRGGGPVVSIPPAPAAIESKDGNSFLAGRFRIPADLAAGNYTVEVLAYDRVEARAVPAAEQWTDLTVVGL